MAKAFIDDTHLTDIADAIRATLDVSRQYLPSEMAAAIQSIPIMAQLNRKKYFQSVPAGAASGYATIEQIKGNTVAWNQLVDTNSTSVVVQSGHVYYANINGTASMATSDGTPISVTGGTDIIHDLTAIFGAGNEPTTVADFEAWMQQNGLPSIADYNAGELLSVKMSGVQTNTNKLPLGYQELEYIESTGTQYIDTGITNENCDTYGVKTKYYYTAVTAGSSLCGNYEQNTGKASFGQIFVSAAHTGDAVYTGIGNVSTCARPNVPERTELTDEFTINCTAGTISRNFNGESLSGSGLDFSVRSSRHCLLFACNSSSGAIQFANIRIYYFQILKDGKTVFNFIPCKNASGVVGMYDTVSNTFFTNSGTGTFIGGPEVHLDTLPFEVTTITGINPNTNVREVIFPNGMKQADYAGTAKDTLDLRSDTATVNVGSRAYQSGDESDPDVLTDGTTTYYALTTPIEYTDLQDQYGNPLNPRYKVEQGGTEQVLPVNTSTPTTVAPTLTTTYTKDNN